MRTCEEYQELISCLLDGELTAEEQADVEAHIARCGECRAMYEVFAAVSAVETESVPDGLHENIMRGVNKAAKFKKMQTTLRRLRPILSAAACLVVLVGTVFAFSNICTGRNNGNDTSAPKMAFSTTAATTESVMECESAADEPAAEAVCGSVEEPAPIQEERSASAPFSAEASAAASEEETTEAGESVNGASYDGMAKGADAELITAARVLPAGAEKALPVNDTDALCAALAAKPAGDVADVENGPCNYMVELTAANGTVRRLNLYFDGELVWVEEDGGVFLAACTPTELEEIFNQ